MIRPLLFTIAVLLILFGFSGLYMLPKMINQKIEQKLQIKIGTKLFDRFQNIPVSLKIKFYFHNITNKEQVLAGFERPKFEEVGPFIFEERRKRYVMDFEEDGRKLRYRESKFYYPTYNKEKQEALYANATSLNGTKPLTDDYRALDPNAHNITIINVPLLSVLTKLATLPEGSLKRTLASKIAQRLVEDGQDKILVTRPANEILFDGYKVDFLEAARKLFEDLGNFNFDSPLPGNKFGFYFMKNGTWNKNEGGEFLIWTGRFGSMTEFPQIVSWNDQSMLKVWPNDTRAGDRCNRVHGTDGSSFHPGLSRHQTLYVFSPLICTSIYFKYVEDTQVNGIPVWRYTTPPDVFAAPGKNERKQCYCTIKQANGASSLATSGNASNQENDGLTTTSSSALNQLPASAINNSRCFIDGILDLSLCQKGAPIAASGAHFYNADPMLALSTGLKPDKAKHETFIDIEPMTGNVMRASSRAQLNAFVEEAAMQLIDSNVTGHMTPMIAPLLWLEETGGIDDKLAAEFKGKLLNLVLKVRRTCVICIITGLVLIVLVCIHYWYTTCYQIDLKAIRDRAEKKKQRRIQNRTRRDPRRRPIHIDEDKNFDIDSDIDRVSFRKSGKKGMDPVFVGSDALAGSMGAVGAELPISASDKSKLINGADDDDQESLEQFRLAETRLEAEAKQPQTQQPTTSSR